MWSNRVSLFRFPSNKSPLVSDSQIVVPATTESTKTFYKLGNDSFKLVVQKMNWDEARRQCKADDAEMASILNPITQAFITMQSHKYNEPMWIGLNNNLVKVFSFDIALCQSFGLQRLNIPDNMLIRLIINMEICDLQFPLYKAQ